MSPSVYLLLFIFSKFPLCIFPLTLSPAFFPPCSLYQVLYNVGSPDVLPASIRHFDSVQLSMIMYFSLNHSFSPFLSCLPSPSLSLPPKHTCTGTPICCSPCNPGLPWKWQITVWNVKEETQDKMPSETYTRHKRTLRNPYDMCLIVRVLVQLQLVPVAETIRSLIHSLSVSVPPPHRLLYSLE